MGLICAGMCCACQAISCACSLASCCFSSATGKSGVDIRAAKLFYILMLGFSTILAFSLKYSGLDWSKSMGPFAVSIGCTNTSYSPGYDYSIYGASAQGYCAGDAAVYRISLALSLFFVVMMGLSLVSDGLFRGFWFFKILFFAGGLVGCFFIPEVVFASGWFPWIARIASSLFLILQILILVDFGYSWNEQWVAHAYEGCLTDYDEPKHKGWLIAVLISAAGLYIVAITGIVLLYIYYGNTCSDVQAIISVTLIMVLAFTALSLFRDKIVGMEGAILPSAVVATYVVYLTWSGLDSNPSTVCRPTVQRSTTTTILGIAFAALSLMWTSFTAQKNTENLLRGEEDAAKGASATEQQPFYRVDDNGKTKNVSDLESNKKTSATASIKVPGNKDTEAGGATTTSTEAEGKDNDKPPEHLHVFFILLIAGALYMSMLLTNWGEATSDINGSTGTASMWVKIISAYIAMLLYIWTLIAPLVCKNRQFS